MSRPILDGLKVVDAASFIAGPTAGTAMADFGADVIKVESPALDGYRRLRDTPGFPDAGFDYYWQLDNRSKRGIVMDLNTEVDRARLRSLLATADVFITNHPLPVRRKLGLTWKDVQGLNARLIYASLTAYGETGPEADSSGFDATTYWARSGLMHVVRPDMAGPPALSVAGQGDHPTAMALLSAILLAIIERMSTGRGREVHTSLIANGLWSNAVLAQGALTGAPPIDRRPRQTPWSAMVNYYPTRDERWFIISALEPERDWQRLLEVIARPDLADDPRFRTIESRREHATQLVAVLDPVFRQHDLSYWLPRFAAVKLAVGPVLSTNEAVHDAQARASGAIVQAAPEAQVAEVIDSPIWVSDSPKVPAGPAPKPDGDGDAIRAALDGGASPWRQG
ncbi:MAG: CoA transferase [Pseudomonadota bacterium]|nr:CoA transferase [Pseudomonadota bacterium]